MDAACPPGRTLLQTALAARNPWVLQVSSCSCLGRCRLLGDVAYFLGHLSKAIPGTFAER